MPLLASLSSLSYFRTCFPETRVELGSYRNESRRTRMRFARAGGGSAVVCVWRIVVIVVQIAVVAASSPPRKRFFHWSRGSQGLETGMSITCL